LWANIGYHPKDFIKGLLVLKEEERMTASEALAHEWFSSYAEDFDKLYTNATADWEPREKNLDLVEIIPKSLYNRAAANLIGGVQSPGINSQHFPLRQSQNTYRMVQSAQRWRGRTPLPSIMQDHEAVQFASQVQASSNDERGMYRFTEHADDDSDGSEKSLNGVMNDYSQQEYYEHLPPPPGHDSVLVSETPIDVYRQSQQIKDHGQDSVLVQETPPEFLCQHVYLSDDDVSVCDL
jgi:serine/threonine protein kinase